MLLLCTLAYLFLLTLIEYLLGPIIPGYGTVSLLLRMPIFLGLSIALTYVLVYVISIYQPSFRERLLETISLVGVKLWSGSAFVVSVSALVYPLIAHQQFPGEMTILLLFPIAGVSLLNLLGIEKLHYRLAREPVPDAEVKPFVLPEVPEPFVSPNEDDSPGTSSDSDDSSDKAPTAPDDNSQQNSEDEELSDTGPIPDETVAMPSSDLESPDGDSGPPQEEEDDSSKSGEGRPMPPSPLTELPGSDPDKSRNTYHWEFKGEPYQISLEISKQTYGNLKSRPRCLDVSEWGHVYVTNGISDEIRQIVAKLLEQRTGYGTYEDVSFVLSFVQCVIRYELDVGEYPKYPLETLGDGSGDCEDFSMLGAALLKCMDYDVALLFMPGHCALGVAGANNLPGTYVSHNGVRYYYCEMTATGWKIGDVPDNERNSSFEVTPIEKPPPRVVVPN